MAISRFLKLLFVVDSSSHFISYALTLKNSNPNYPDIPFDNYLANPYFQKINTDYPGLQLVHENPFLFIANDFFTYDECNRLINKAVHSGLREQVGGGSVVRTSNGIVCENEEVPTLRQKMMDFSGY